MSTRREWVAGLLAALLTVFIVAGSFVISASENQTALAESSDTPTPTNTAFTLPTPAPTQKPGEPTYTPSATPLPPSSTPMPTTLASCPPPVGWVQIQVPPGETLTSLAQQYGLSPDELLSANCLEGSSVLSGMPLYLPALPTATQTASQIAPCLPPAGWSTYYTIRSGDTLSKIARDYGITAAEIQRANCMGNSTLIIAGKQILVPNWASLTPAATFTTAASLTPVPPKTATFTPVPPSATPTNTTEIVTIVAPSETPSPTFTVTPTGTATPTATFTSTDTSTPTPTSTFTEPPSPTPPPTRTPTATSDGS